MGTREVLNSSKSNERYTPYKLIKEVRHFLIEKRIELDPASCDLANFGNEKNQGVGAERFFTEEDNGLNQDWIAKTVFCNPPYGKYGKESSASVWLRKMANEFEKGHFEEGFLLIPAAVGTEWFFQVWKYPVVLLKKRLKFWAEDIEKSQPINGNCLVYFGPRDKWYMLRPFFGPEKIKNGFQNAGFGTCTVLEGKVVLP